MLPGRTYSGHTSALQLSSSQQENNCGVEDATAAAGWQQAGSGSEGCSNEHKACANGDANEDGTRGGAGQDGGGDDSADKCGGVGGGSDKSIERKSHTVALIAQLLARARHSMLNAGHGGCMTGQMHGEWTEGCSQRAHGPGAGHALGGLTWPGARQVGERERELKCV